MIIMECSDCGCPKSEHNSRFCKSCLIIYQGNYKEYVEYVDSYSDMKAYKGPWHEFKLDNLRYLEQCYERKEVG